MAQTESCTATDTAVTAVITDTNDTDILNRLAQDCAILLDIKSTLEGTADGRKSLNWSRSLSMAQWEGITVSRRVTQIQYQADLTGVVTPHLTGSLPARLNELTGLKNILLVGTRLTGGIPDLSGLTNLVWLQVHGNQLSGTVNPNHLPASLETLSLADNQFSGSLPELTRFPSLKRVTLQQNQFTGAIPANWNARTTLTKLNVSDNELSGTIPDLSALVSLTDLFLNVNEFSGSIPDLSALASLEYLALSDNQLSGSINAGHFPTSLQGLYLHRNQLTGSIPDLSSLTSLIHLYLHQNQLSGAIPATLGAVASLERLFLMGNGLTGVIPSQLGSLTSLGHLGLCGTNLDASATLPSALETLRTDTSLTVWSCVSIDDAAGTEGSTLSFTVKHDIYPVRGSASASDMPLDYATEDGTATSPEDYTGATMGSVTVPGNTNTGTSSSTATISVDAATDSVPENHETFRVHLSGFPSGVIPLNRAAIGTIINAPEVEAWEGWERAPGSRGANATLSRPNTVASTPGIWPRQDMVFGGRPQDYVIRLSSRPEPGGTVTVNVSRNNSDVQLGLTMMGPWSNSLTVTFGDGFAAGANEPNMAACNNSHDWTKGGEAHDGTPATSWECWRKVWLRRVGESHHCTDITHTASGGGVRSRTIETIRVHNPTSVRNNNHSTVCAFLTPKVEPRNALAMAPDVQVPDSQVANVRVTAVDAANAKVTWDAVEHATSYEVEYETSSALVDELNRVQGAVIGWTGTELTFQHDAAEAMTLTVTVTPAYEDGNGDTQHLDNLAGTATIDVGPPAGDSIRGGGSTDSVDAGTGNTPQQPDYSALKATVRGYADETEHGDDHVNRWKRALAGLGDEDAIAEGYTPMTAAEAQEMADTYTATRWNPIVEALTDLESRQTAEPEPEPEPEPAPEPEPEPEPDPVSLGACVSVSQWDTVAGYYDRNAYRSPNYGANWYRVLIAYHEDRSDKTMPDWVGSTSKPSSAFTVADAEAEESKWFGWTPVRKVLQCLKDESGQSFVPLLPGSSNPAYDGVVRFTNPAPQGGSVRITATDDSGWRPDPVTLYVGPGRSVDLTNRDLEQGNTAKGLSGHLGWGTGDWRLDVSGRLDVPGEPDVSGLPDIQVQPYARMANGGLAPMHAIAEVEQGNHQVPTFTPAGGAANDPSSRPTDGLNPAGLNQTGLLRLINRGDEALTAHITGTDDSGRQGGEVSLDMAAGEAVLLTAAELEGGSSGLSGALGDGEGMWRLSIASGGDLAVMSLLESSGGHLTNLSTGASPARPSDGVHAVSYFPSASDSRGRQGMIRIINDTAIDVPVHVQPRDDTARRYEPLTLIVGAGEAVHLDSWDLELGDPSSGLSGGTGAGSGDWRLDIASWPGVEVQAYVRSLNGTLTPVQDLADEAGKSHEEAR